MKNIEPQTDIEVLLAWLNQLAKAFEQGNFLVKEFIPMCIGAISASAKVGTIDRIQTRLLIDQAIDISKKEYTRFCDPDSEFISTNDEGFDSQGYPEQL